MKRLIAFLCVLLLLGAAALPALAVGQQAVYVLSQNGTDFSMSQQPGELTFWEAPDVVTGQSRTDGVITLKNDTDRVVDFELSSVSLPYDDPAALTYLNAVTVRLAEGDTVYYQGPFARLSDGERPPVRLSEVEPGETRQICVSIACAFTYEGQAPSYSSLVWTFSPVIHARTTVTVPKDPLTPRRTIRWELIAQTAGVVVASTAAAGVYLKLRKRRKK